MHVDAESAYARGDPRGYWMSSIITGYVAGYLTELTNSGWSSQPACPGAPLSLPPKCFGYRLPLYLPDFSVGPRGQDSGLTQQAFYS